MYSRSIIIALFLAVMPLTAEAQSYRVVKNKSELDPPSIQIVLSGTHTNSDAVLTQLLDVPATIPVGPIAVLKGYESAMTAIEESTVAVLSDIAQAVFEGQITSVEADYLTQERYEVSMMQYQVLSALHASLAHEIEQAASKRQHRQDVPDTAGAVETSSTRRAR